MVKVKCVKNMPVKRWKQERASPAWVAGELQGNDTQAISTPSQRQHVTNITSFAGKKVAGFSYLSAKTNTQETLPATRLHTSEGLRRRTFIRRGVVGTRVAVIVVGRCSKHDDTRDTRVKPTITTCMHTLTSANT